jgi:hypothetical protein
MLSATVAEVLEAIKTLQQDVHEVRGAIRALHEDVREVQKDINDLQENIQIMRAQPPDLVRQADEIKVRFETLTAMFQQCQLSNNSEQRSTAAGTDQLAVVPAGSHNGPQTWHNSTSSPSTDWNRSADGNSGWAGWEAMNGVQTWQHWDQEEIVEIPFSKAPWIKVPGPCLYADKECDEGTMAEYFVYFKSRGHRKNEILCKACTVAHKQELSGIMKIRY